MSLNAETSEQLRAALSGEIQSLRRQLDELGFGCDGSGAGLDYDANHADSSQVTAEKGEAASLAASLRESLGDNELALSKLEDGSFGRCEACNSEIALDRLEAMPTSRYCIDCVSSR